MTAIDLNSDLGESYGAWAMGDDEAMLAIVSSANVACGFHAGDPVGILKTVKAAAERGVSVGAHVSYPDRVGFGQRCGFLYHSGRQTVLHRGWWCSRSQRQCNSGIG